jgi:hypothetical protein
MGDLRSAYRYLAPALSSSGFKVVCILKAQVSRAV